jgi:alanine dehydrogenase
VNAYESASAPIAAETSKFVSKQSGGKGVITGGDDLVEAVNNKSVKLADIPAAELPENMRKMTTEEKEAFVAARIKTRERLSKELAEAINKRDLFIAAAEEKEKPKGDSFDRAVARTLKSQVK